MIDKRGPLKSKAQQRSGTHYNKKWYFTEQIYTLQNSLHHLYTKFCKTYKVETLNLFWLQSLARKLYLDMTTVARLGDKINELSAVRATAAQSGDCCRIRYFPVLFVILSK